MAFCSLLSALCPTASGEIIDRILAILPGQIITLSDVGLAVELGIVEVPEGAGRTSAALSALIDRILMLNEVRRVMPPEPAAAAIDQRVARIRQRFDSAESLSRALTAGGIDESVLRMYAADDLRLSAYLEERFAAASQLTEQEIRQAGEASRQRLADERRRTLIAAWTSELRRRAEVTVVGDLESKK